jgi:hypothetical protein
VSATSKKSKGGLLTAKTLRIPDVDASTRDVLFTIFHRYYDMVSRAQFEKDFSEKNAVILLCTKDGVPHGFSTLKDLDTVVDGRRVRGVFSGDTVIEKEFWGQGSLGVEFLKYLFSQKTKAPFTPFYWFLISKGYKTYLLMANNFDHHWPRHDDVTPAFERRVLDTWGSAMFGDAYRGDDGLIVWPESLGQLKEGVADIDRELIETNPRVAFFQQKNPTWQHGTELCCLAKMTWAMPFTYWWKVMTTKRTPKVPRALESVTSGGVKSSGRVAS